MTLYSKLFGNPKKVAAFIESHIDICKDDCPAYGKCYLQKMDTPNPDKAKCVDEITKALCEQVEEPPEEEYLIRWWLEGAIHRVKTNTEEKAKKIFDSIKSERKTLYKREFGSRSKMWVAIERSNENGENN